MSIYAHVCMYLWRPEVGTGSPETGVTPTWMLETELGSFEIGASALSHQVISQDVV